MGAALATGATLAFTGDQEAEVGDRTPKPMTVVSHPSAGYPASADAAEQCMTSVAANGR